MLEQYEAYSGIRPTNESDIMIRLRVLAGEIFREQANADFILRQMFPTTAVGEYLDRHAAERGLSRIQAKKAVGTARFYPEEVEHGDIVIPAGTTACTDDGQKRFLTDEQAVLGREQDYVDVAMTAEQAGADYNIGGGYLTTIVTPVMGIARVHNASTFKYGVDTERDEALRSRIVDSYVHISNGANAAYYQQTAMSVPGVYSASVVGCARGAGTVDVYACDKGELLTDAKLAEIRALMAEARELNVDVQVRHPEEIEVNLCIILSLQAGYDFATVAEQVRSAVSGYIEALGLGGNIRLSDIGEVVYHIKGVRSYRFIESYGSDRTIALSQYPVAGSILVREA